MKRTLGMGIIIVIIDQASKFWAETHLTSLVTLNYLGSGSLPWLGTEKVWWLGGVALVLGGLLIWAHQQLHQFPNQWLAWGLIIGGGVSNWLDRWQWGGVRDWLLLPLPGFPLKNNLADYALALGVILLIFHWLTVKSRHTKNHAA